MTATRKAIQVVGLTKVFGAVTAVDDLNFEVAPGQVVGFLGANGAGKTTTLRMLLGLASPTAGQALIHGLPYTRLTRPLHAVGAALEATGFHPGRTARSHLHIHALAGSTSRERVDEVLALVGLEEAADRRVGTFSLGMRQRLELATALLHQPEILILDEPANGLDPEGIRWLRDLLRGLASAGHTVLVSSHVLAEVAQVVDSVVIIDHGRLVLQSSLADLGARGRGRGSLRVRTSQAAQLHAVLARTGVSATVVGTDLVEVVDATGEQVGTLAAQRGIPIFETALHTPNLEEIFVQLIADSRLEAAL